MSDQQGNPVKTDQDASTGVKAVVPDDMVVPESGRTFNRLPEPVDESELPPPYDPGPESAPLAEGYTLAKDLGPGDTVWVPLKVHTTVWDAMGFVTVTTDDGRSFGPFGKESAVRTAP